MRRKTNYLENETTLVNQLYRGSWRNYARVWFPSVYAELKELVCASKRTPPLRGAQTSRREARLEQRARQRLRELVGGEYTPGVSLEEAAAFWFRVLLVRNELESQESGAAAFLEHLGCSSRRRVPQAVADWLWTQCHTVTEKLSSPVFCAYFREETGAVWFWRRHYQALVQLGLHESAQRARETYRAVLKEYREGWSSDRVAEWTVQWAVVERVWKLPVGDPPEPNVVHPLFTLGPSPEYSKPGPAFPTVAAAFASTLAGEPVQLEGGGSLSVGPLRVQLSLPIRLPLRGYALQEQGVLKEALVKLKAVRNYVQTLRNQVQTNQANLYQLQIQHEQLTHTLQQQYDAQYQQLIQELKTENTTLKETEATKNSEMVQLNSELQRLQSEQASWKEVQNKFNALTIQNQQLQTELQTSQNEIQQQVKNQRNELLEEYQAALLAKEQEVTAKVKTQFQQLYDTYKEQLQQQHNTDREQLQQQYYTEVGQLTQNKNQMTDGPEEALYSQIEELKKQVANFQPNGMNANNEFRGLNEKIEAMNVVDENDDNLQAQVQGLQEQLANFQNAMTDSQNGQAIIYANNCTSNSNEEVLLQNPERSDVWALLLSLGFAPPSGFGGVLRAKGLSSNLLTKLLSWEAFPKALVSAKFGTVGLGKIRAAGHSARQRYCNDLFGWDPYPLAATTNERELRSALDSSQEFAAQHQYSKALVHLRSHLALKL